MLGRNKEFIRFPDGGTVEWNNGRRRVDLNVVDQKEEICMDSHSNQTGRIQFFDGNTADRGNDVLHIGDQLGIRRQSLESAEKLHLKPPLKLRTDQRGTTAVDSNAPSSMQMLGARLGVTGVLAAGNYILWRGGFHLIDQDQELLRYAGTLVITQASMVSAGSLLALKHTWLDHENPDNAHNSIGL